ncbi:MAG TPA: PEP-CTERM sorting domain-containing protein [Gemmatimonadaceae bacterium]|nr:PEP-CTERM sorting domain-containing protein [Gemmatimonadaceae bacterium]
MKLKVSAAALAVAGSLALTAPASAQTTFKFLNGGTVTAFGFYVGPYNGLMGDPPTPVVLNCVDFFHDVVNNEVWTANLTNLGTGIGVGSVTRNSSLQLYQEAAWLTTQYPTNPTTTAQRQTVADIQATMWDLFPIPSGYSAPPTPTSSYWLGQAQANYGSIDYSNFWVVTAVNKDDPASAQEFIMRTTTTPEPSTIVLLLTGLGLVGLVAWRRRERAAALQPADALA